jgi:hypothetical protein
MRILLALVSFVISAALLGFFAFCGLMAVSELGLVEAILQIIGDWENIIIMGGCLLFGLAFLGGGLCVLAVRLPTAARE